jgi:hypothetical protein
VCNRVRSAFAAQRSSVLCRFQLLPAHLSQRTCHAIRERHATLRRGIAIISCQSSSSSVVAVGGLIAKRTGVATMASRAKKSCTQARVRCISQFLWASDLSHADCAAHSRRRFSGNCSTHRRYSTFACIRSRATCRISWRMNLGATCTKAEPLSTAGCRTWVDDHRIQCQHGIIIASEKHYQRRQGEDPCWRAKMAEMPCFLPCRTVSPDSPVDSLAPLQPPLA